MPVYEGEVVSLLKGTSIVGYIAVADMTRASDLIRSRTFYAFLPIILTAVIYFFMAWLIGRLLKSLVEKRHLKALDPTMVGEVLSVIRQLADEGMTMLIVTHKMKFAYDVSTRIFFMYGGFIHEDGTPEQIFENPVHSATKAFIQRIRKEVFEIDGKDFDFLGMHSSINAFCYKYGIMEKQLAVRQLTEKMINDVMAAYRPMTVRITHSEQSGVTALDFMVEKMDATPLSEQQRSQLSKQCRQVVEEPTERGFRVKLIV